MSDGPRYRSRGGFRLGHALLILSLGVLTFSVRAPKLRREAFERRVERVDEAVSILRGATERFHARRGRWPGGAAAGTVPAALRFDVPQRFAPAGEGYTLAWSRWERIVREPAPAADSLAPSDPAPLRTSTLPSRPRIRVAELGGITVASADSSLRAALLARHGRERSFVHDTTFTIVLYDVPGG
ncbi:MAG TPA: hypothetical protein VK849_02050 [Longimicrobiales bacterium]|nr:hypothetical protein [Longimicrobiales bacterium]